MARLLFVVFVFFAMCGSYSPAFAREQVAVKATQNGEYIRLFFYTKQPVNLNTSLKGKILKISFSRDIDVDTAAIVGASQNDISGASYSNKTATITLADDSYKVRKFLGEDFVGIDILKSGVSKTPVAQTAQNLEPVQVPAALPEEENIDKNPSLADKKIELKQKLSRLSEAEKVVASIPQVNEINPEGEYIPVKREVKSQALPEKIARIIPTPKLRPTPAQTELAKAEPKVIANPIDVAKLAAISPAAQAAPDVAKTLETPASAAFKKEDKPTEPASVTTAAPLSPTANNAEIKTPVEGIKTPVENAKPTPEPENNTVAVNPSPPTEIKSGNSDEKADKAPPSSAASATPMADDIDDIEEDGQKPKIASAVFKDNLINKISFQWSEPVAASVFKRAGYLWIVFDKDKQVNVQKLVKDNDAYFVKGEQMPNRFYTILRFKLKTDVNPVSYKENNDWIVGFVKEKTAPLNNIKLDMKFSDLKGSKVILDSGVQLKPLRLLDSEVGDEIVILPFIAESAGTKEQYKYIDFAFLEAAQGAVIQVVSDGVDVSVVDIGVEIVGPSNRIANASQSALKELREKEEEMRLKAEKLRQQSAELTLLKYTTWKLGGETSYEKDLQEITWKIISSPWADKNQYRLSLARFYFAHGLYSESLGAIAMIKEYDEKFGKSNEIKIVEATDLYMLARYKEALEVYNSINTAEMLQTHREELQFWVLAANIHLNNEIKTDKFLTKNPLEKKEEEDVSSDKVSNTKLMRDTSARLLKIIRKMDPDFINTEEIQKLEATARFVTEHYQEEIDRFQESEVLSSGSDAFQAEDNKLWWSTTENKRSDVAELPLISNLDSFLKEYPDNIFNDFALLAVEDALKRNDLAKSEEILASFKDETRVQQKNSIEFFRGLFYAKNEEDDKAIDTWKKLSEEIMDPYNRMRSQFASTIFQLDKKKIDAKQAIANLNTVRSAWRGDNLEFHTLTLLGEFYQANHQAMEAFRVWREAINAFPGSDESLLIAKKMSDEFVKIFAHGEADKMSKIDAITLYYEFRDLTPIGKPGDEMISKLVDRLIDVDLLDRAAALLTHQVRFRLSGEEKDIAATKLIKVHLMNHDPQKALDVLDATETAIVNPDVVTERKYLRAQAFLDLGKNNKVLSVLTDDNTKKASFLRADVYWRNGVWRKVIDELEVPFRDLRRDDKALNLEETNQLIRLAVAYALIDRQKRLQILYEDFAGLVEDPAKKNLLTFIASNKGPVDFRNLDQTIEYNDMEKFLNNYMKMQIENSTPEPISAPGTPPPAPAADAPAPSAQAAPTPAAG